MNRDRSRIHRRHLRALVEVSFAAFSSRLLVGWIEIAPEQDDALILAVAVCIDQMSRG